MSFYGKLRKKIRLQQDITEQGSGITHDIPLTFEEMAYILGSMQVSNSLHRAVKEGSEDARTWMASKDNKRYREDGTVIPTYDAPDQPDRRGDGRMSRVEQVDRALKFLSEKNREKPEGTFEEMTVWHLGIIGTILADISRSLAVIADSTRDQEGEV